MTNTAFCLIGKYGKRLLFIVVFPYTIHINPPVPNSRRPTTYKSHRFSYSFFFALSVSAAELV